MSVGDRTGGATVDLDLHGIVGIRLLDARPADVARVGRQLGPIQGRLRRAPDVVVRFVDAVDDPGTLTYAGVRDAGWTEDGFYVLRGAGGVQGRARIPFQDIGSGCEIVCERSLPSVPLLLAIVNLVALANGAVPLHASAFVHEGRGVLAMGWAKGGKTETLLSFAAAGASYVGDEWVYLTPDGRMCGVPEPIRLWDWQLDQLPTLRGRLTRRERSRLRALRAVARATSGLDRLLRGTPLTSVARRAVPVVERQVYVQVPPARLFAGHVERTARLDEAVLAVSHDSPRTVVSDVPSTEVTERMLASLEHERDLLLAYYRQFRFAFPHLSSPAVEQAARIERELLSAVLRDVAVRRLAHPYPVDISSLRAHLVRTPSLSETP